jgi:hypothetical protein
VLIENEALRVVEEVRNTLAHEARPNVFFPPPAIRRKEDYLALDLAPSEVDFLWFGGHRR